MTCRIVNKGLYEKEFVCYIDCLFSCNKPIIRMPKLEEDNNIASSRFQRRVFQISPQERDAIHQTSRATLSKVNISSDRVISGKDSRYQPKHRDVYFPLLIKIFSTQEQIRNLRSAAHIAFPDETKIRSPADIRADLEQIITEIEESQRWNDGVILQAKKAIAELNQIDHPQKPEIKKESLLKKILKKLKIRA
ncbi:MAG: hypothetical protein HY860_06730 [Chlamydiales bacterium]|nr:hypothetical protein [Chlamydiales bacterium]